MRSLCFSAMQSCRRPVGRVALAVFLWAAAGAAGETESSHLSGTSEALVRLDRPAGWSVGAEVRFDRRLFETSGDEELRLDSNYVLARVGYAPMAPLQIYGELGWNQADDEDRNEKGESGLAWSAGILGNLVEYVIRSSPVTGTKEAFGLGGELAYRHAESNFSERDFSWGEFIVMPTVQYTRNYEGDWERHRKAPPEILLRGGVLFSSIDGDYGDADVEGKHNFALHLGFATRWAGSWVTRVYGNFYGSSDRSIGLACAYHF